MENPGRCRLFDAKSTTIGSKAITRSYVLVSSATAIPEGQ